ncbi:mitochondrial genome maintenance MGM101, partial [Martensiomyces pterosporus]
WSTSFQGMASEPFDARIGEVLMAPVVETDIEIKPDGLLYLPEIKYRRILNRAFGPGGWGLVPRGAHSVSGRTLSREYALVCLGRFISQARGEQDFFDESGLATATEGCKSNALVRCCKDLGVASELWDPAFVSRFKAEHCAEEWVTHAVKGNKKRMWRRRDRQWEYPWAKK